MNSETDSGQSGVNSKDLSTEDTPTERPIAKRRLEKDKHIRGRSWIAHIAVGLSDGLVTNLALLAGFAAADSSLGTLRLAGAAALFAGSVSMFFSGMLEKRSENDLFKADSMRELEEIEKEPEEERSELKSMYMDKGLTTSEAELVVRRVSSNKKKWLEDVLLHELRLHKSNLENPYWLGLFTALSFLGGAFIPLAPYLFLSVRDSALVLSATVSLIFIFGIGVWKGSSAKKSPWRSGAEMIIIIAVVATLILFAIGQFLIVV